MTWLRCFLRERKIETDSAGDRSDLSFPAQKGDYVKKTHKRKMLAAALLAAILAGIIPAVLLFRGYLLEDGDPGRRSAKMEKQEKTSGEGMKWKK